MENEDLESVKKEFELSENKIKYYEERLNEIKKRKRELRKNSSLKEYDNLQVICNTLPVECIYQKKRLERVSEELEKLLTQEHNKDFEKIESTKKISKDCKEKIERYEFDYSLFTKRLEELEKDGLVVEFNNLTSEYESLIKNKQEERLNRDVLSETLRILSLRYYKNSRKTDTIKKKR